MIGKRNRTKDGVAVAGSAVARGTAPPPMKGSCERKAKAEAEFVQLTQAGRGKKNREGVKKGGDRS